MSRIITGESEQLFGLVRRAALKQKLLIAEG